jgi:putative ABC transport system substrate-binding protein
MPLMMDRRLFCGALASAWAAGAWGQRNAGRIYRVGYLTVGTISPQEESSELRTELARLGFTEGTNLVMEYWSAHGNPALLEGLALDLVAKRPDLIYTDSGYLGTLAAKKATTSIPIVFEAVGFPVESGFVASLTRPGGNLTGGMIPDLELKRVQILLEVVGSTAAIVQLTAPLNDSRKTSFRKALDAHGLKEAARRFEFVEVERPEDLSSAFEQISRIKPGGVAIRNGQLTGSHEAEIASLVVKHRLPAIASGSYFARDGVLLSYAHDDRELARLGASFVARILNGAQPGELPIEQVTKFEFVINLKVAKALGIRFPASVLVAASDVIQ